MSAWPFPFPPQVRDWIVALGVTAALLATAVSEQPPSRPADLVGYVLLASSGLLLAAGRRRPVPVLITIGLCEVGRQAVGLGVPAVAFPFAVYAAMRAGHRLVSVLACVSILVALPFAVPAAGDGLGSALERSRSVLEIAWLVAAAAAGEALRQAERRADDAVRTRDEAARRRADEERLHIARELHDSLTHQISIIKVQADVAVHVARRQREDVSDTLLAIQDAAREASRELRATLGALRDDGTAPPRGIAQVPDLVDRSRAIGLDAVLTLEAGGHDLPAAVDRTAYRVIQEALTNVARHAGATTVRVDVAVGAEGLVVQVDDDGRALPGVPPALGTGLLGMRERVAALGGRLRAEPRAAGGFTVRAEIPAGPQAPTAGPPPPTAGPPPPTAGPPPPTAGAGADAAGHAEPAS
ncbi:sensor histidine kinase [Myceligenerans indicum]|uniref:histidine kinase n=1 Tax=Myceligenerans indicum TaxID=2593663 RepID=A0ABS1LKE6_9MICO|nr:sensor histidine kinase [Myceligenerans indicum]MBL0886686.1 sensor histidine kinase [Myceligenerans indicum]